MNNVKKRAEINGGKVGDFVSTSPIKRPKCLSDQKQS